MNAIIFSFPFLRCIV